MFVRIFFISSRPGIDSVFIYICPYCQNDLLVIIVWFCNNLRLIRPPFQIISVFRGLVPSNFLFMENRWKSARRISVELENSRADLGKIKNAKSRVRNSCLAKAKRYGFTYDVDIRISEFYGSDNTVIIEGQWRWKF